MIDMVVMMSETQTEVKKEMKPLERCNKCGKQVRYSGSHLRHRGFEEIWQHFDGKKWTTNCSKGGKHHVGPGKSVSP